MGCGDEKLSKYLTQTFTAHCNAMICQQVMLSGDAEWPKVADAVIEAFRGISKTNLPGYVGFFQFLRNFRQQNAFEQAELILRAALDPAIASRAKKGEFVKCFDHFDLLQTAIN